MKTLFITTALALFAAPAIAETKSQWGCEWKYGENGNYLTKVDGGCKHWIGLGYATQAAMNKDVPPATEDDSEEPSDPGDGEGPGDEGTDPGEGPGEGPGECPGDDNAGPGDDGGNGAGPDDNGGGDEGPGTEGPSKPGKPGKPGKGKGRR